MTIFLLMAGFVVYPLLAQNVKMNVRGHIGYSYLWEKNIDAGLESGFGFSVPFTKRIAFAFDVGYWKNEVHQRENQLLDGSLTITPFYFSIHYHLWPQARFVPYVFAGGGLVFTSFKKEDIIGIPEITIRQEVDDGLGWQTGGGALLKINQRLALYGEFEYLHKQGKGTTTITDMNFGTRKEHFSVSLNSFLLRIGLKYFF